MPLKNSKTKKEITQKNLEEFIRNNSCFDLQFRKDAKLSRTGAPVYYRWKAQFILSLPEKSVDLLVKIKNSASCGKIHFVKGQARYSVQNIAELNNNIVPFIENTGLAASKKNDFKLWSEAVTIIYKNKGKKFTDWDKNDFEKLMALHKSSAKHKQKPRDSKWISIANQKLKNLTPQ